MIDADSSFDINRYKFDINRYNNVKNKQYNTEYLTELLDNQLKQFFYFNISTSEQEDMLYLPHKVFIDKLNYKYKNYVRQQKIKSINSNKIKDIYNKILEFFNDIF